MWYLNNNINLFYKCITTFLRVLEPNDDMSVRWYTYICLNFVSIKIKFGMQTPDAIEV